MTLNIYRAPSGQWSGTVFDTDGQEIGGIAGCASPDEVEEQAYDSWPELGAIDECAIHCDACGLSRGELGPEGDLLCCGGAAIADADEAWIN